MHLRGKDQHAFQIKDDFDFGEEATVSPRASMSGKTGCLPLSHLAQARPARKRRILRMIKQNSEARPPSTPSTI